MGILSRFLKHDSPGKIVAGQKSIITQDVVHLLKRQNVIKFPIILTVTPAKFHGFIYKFPIVKFFFY